MDFHIDIDSEQDNTSHNNKNDMQAYLGSQDEVINTTSWKPLNGSGQSYKSHTLESIGNDRLLFKRSFVSVLFNLMFGFFGLILVFVSIFGRMLGASGSGNPLWGVGIGLLFIGVGVFLYVKGAPRINLDRRLNAMWLGKIDAAAVINKKSIESYTSLEDLHAVQLIQKLIRGDRASNGKRHTYYSYELNLVMSDGRRINVLDHGNKKAIVEHAQAIATLFEIPLWDGCRTFEDEGGTGGWMNRILNLVYMGKMIFGFIVFGVMIVVFYNIYQSAVEEEKMLSSLSPKEAAVLSAQSSDILLKQVRDANISLPQINSLIKKGAYVDVKDSLGRTPLFYAVMQKNFDFTNTFIRAGADVNIKDHKGKSLKDLLDPQQDKFLYYYIIDAQLQADAAKRGKRIISIDRKFDANGKMTHQKVNER